MLKHAEANWPTREIIVDLLLSLIYLSQHVDGLCQSAVSILKSSELHQLFFGPGWYLQNFDKMVKKIWLTNWYSKYMHGKQYYVTIQPLNRMNCPSTLPVSSLCFYTPIPGQITIPKLKLRAFGEWFPSFWRWFPSFWRWFPSFWRWFRIPFLNHILGWPWLKGRSDPICPFWHREADGSGHQGTLSWGYPAVMWNSRSSMIRVNVRNSPNRSSQSKRV